MRSPLFSGVPPRHVPAHAQSGRTTTIVATAAATAGLTLTLLPAVLGGSTASAAGAATPTMRTSAPAATTTSGKAVVGGRLLTPAGAPVPGAVLEVQRKNGANSWGTIARGRTDAQGLARIPTSLPGISAVRVHYRGGTALAAVTGKAHRVLAGTELRMSSSTTATGTVRVSGRLVSPAGGVHGSTLEVQRKTGASTWTTIAKGNTNRQGLVRILTPLPKTSTLRVYYRGGTVSARAVSTAKVVTKQSTALGQRAVAEASKYYGRAYRWGATGPSTFDCSGFTGYVYSRLGKSLPRTSRAQAAALPRVAVADKRPGDLIFTYTGGRVTHVGIYAGGNEMWAATKTGDIVRKQSIFSRNITVGRVG